MLSGLRLAISLLTVVPVRRRDDGPEPLSAAPQAMRWAALVGLLLGGVAAGVMALSDLVGHPPLLSAVLGVASTAVLTRGLHLDGLADTADGLGSRLPAAEALAVMRTGDVGPFGVLTLTLVLLAQVTAAAETGPLGLLAAVTVGRVAMTVACRRGVPAARPDGLGARVASSVSPIVAALLVLAAILGAVALGAVALGAVALGAVALGPLGAVGVLAAVAASELLTRRCVRRLGGVTGDVLGAVCEVAVTVALIIFAMSQ